MLDPTVDREPTVTAFRDVLEARVRERCGNIACKGDPNFNTAQIPHEPNALFIINAAIYCAAEDCPLTDPPTSGDREPRLPVPPTPSLEASADMLNA